MAVYLPDLNAVLGVQGDVALGSFTPPNSLSDFAYWHTKLSDMNTGDEDRPDPIMTLVTTSEEYTNTSWVRPYVSATAPREYYKAFDQANPDSSTLLWPRARFAALKAIWDNAADAESHYLTRAQFEVSQGSARNLLSFEASTIEGDVFPYDYYDGGGTLTYEHDGYNGVRQSTDRAFSGTHSIKVIGGTDGMDYSYRAVPFLGMAYIDGLDGLTVTGKIMLSCSVDNRDFRVKVFFFDADGIELAGTLTSSSTTTDGTDQWRSIWVSGTVPAGAVWASVVGYGLAQSYKEANSTDWSWNSTTKIMTITTAAAHGFEVGQQFGMNPVGDLPADVEGVPGNGFVEILSVPTTTTFTYYEPRTPSAASGTVNDTVFAQDVFYVDDVKLLAPASNYGPRDYVSPRTFNVKVRPAYVNYVRNPGIEDAAVGTRGYLAYPSSFMTNDSFETNLTGWVDNPGFWDTATLTRDNTKASHGTWSCKVTLPASSAGNAGVNYLATGLVVGVDYVFMADVFVDTSGPVTASAYFVDDGDETTVTGEWQRVGVWFTATATSHYVGLRCSSYSAGDVFYVDNASLALGFYGNNTRITRDDTVGKSGAASLKVNVRYYGSPSDGVDGVETVTAKNLPGQSLISGLTPGLTYTASVWCKQAPGCPVIRTFWRTGDTLVTGFTSEEIRTNHAGDTSFVDGDWIRFWHRFTLPESGVRGELKFIAGVYGTDMTENVDAIFWLDDFIVNDGDRPVDYFGGNSSNEHVWTGTDGWSRSHWYPGLRERTTLLTELLTKSLPLGTSFVVEFGVDEQTYVPFVGATPIPGAPVPSRAPRFDWARYLRDSIARNKALRGM